MKGEPQTTYVQTNQWSGCSDVSMK